MTTATVDRPDRPSRPAGAKRRRTGLMPSLRRSWDKHWYAWAMVAPVVIVIGVLVLYPLGTASTCRSPTPPS